MSWWLLTVAVWFCVSFGSVAAVYVAASVRERRERSERANGIRARDELVTSRDLGPRSLV